MRVDGVQEDWVMSNESTNSSGGGIGVTGVLGVVFVTLKLVGVIDWSWWWVTSPFWIPAAIVLVILAGVGLVWAIASIKESMDERKELKRQIEDES